MVLAGINFSDGVMVKSYLGFGMTHIREEVSDGQQSGGPIHIYILLCNTLRGELLGLISWYLTIKYPIIYYHHILSYHILRATYQAYLRSVGWSDHSRHGWYLTHGRSARSPPMVQIPVATWKAGWTAGHSCKDPEKICNVGITMS